MGIDLPLVWAVLILFAVMMYVLMDGFDLGIGILYPFFPQKRDRDLMMNTVAPVWDGNETWLVFGAAGLFVAFPLAYSAVLGAFYLPLMLMLMGLIFRGVAFEFRFKAPASKQHYWDRAFIGGSYVATFFQGVTLGGYLEGVPMRAGHYVAGGLGWLAPFPLLVGCGLVVAYALLGATWLVMKTDGDLHLALRKAARPLIGALLTIVVAISVWTPLARPDIAQKWFSWPNLAWLSPAPLLVVLCSFLLRRYLNDARSHAMPFALTLCVVFLAYLGLGISLWPNVISPAVSIWQAAGPPESLGFTLVGALLIVPMILGYTAWGYWVFRGKARADEDHY